MFNIGIGVEIYSHPYENRGFHDSSGKCKFSIYEENANAKKCKFDIFDFEKDFQNRSAY